jgi:hypothetical protein
LLLILSLDLIISQTTLEKRDVGSRLMQSGYEQCELCFVCGWIGHVFYREKQVNKPVHMYWQQEVNENSQAQQKLKIHRN